MKSSTSLRCRSSSRSESCTIFSDNVTASSPISLRSDSRSWWRSVARRSRLASRISSARRVASERASSMICARSAWASSRRRVDSRLVSGGGSLYFFSVSSSPAFVCSASSHFFPVGSLGCSLPLLELLPDRLLALLDPLRDRRKDLLPEEPENDPEDEPLEDERPVGDQEVVGVALGGENVDSIHPASAHLPRTKAKSAANARLMKYAASTRPTVRKN